MKNCEKKWKNDPFNRTKIEFSKHFQKLQFLTVQGSINANIYRKTLKNTPNIHKYYYFEKLFLHTVQRTPGVK